MPDALRTGIRRRDDGKADYGAPDDYGALDDLAARRIHTAPNVQHWENLLRLPAPSSWAPCSLRA